MPKFSIITPVHLWTDKRVQDFLRCIESVRNQTFRDFEWIVVDDGSTLPFLWKNIEDIARVIKQPHLERVCAYNKAFENVTGEWIAFLDSDDELDPEAFTKLDQIIRDNSDYKMFNFGAKYINKDGKESLRGPFILKELPIGHEMFGGGNIVNGTFIFKKEVLDDLGGYPPNIVKDVDCSEINYGTEQPRDLSMSTPYDYSAYMQIKYPELRQFFMVDHEAEPHKIIKELGNPWGQDYGLWYVYTRKYHSKPIDEYLYIVHSK